MENNAHSVLQMLSSTACLTARRNWIWLRRRTLPNGRLLSVTTTVSSQSPSLWPTATPTLQHHFPKFQSLCEYDKDVIQSSQCFPLLNINFSAGRKWQKANQLLNPHRASRPVSPGHVTTSTNHNHECDRWWFSPCDNFQLLQMIRWQLPRLQLNRNLKRLQPKKLQPPKSQQQQQRGKLQVIRSASLRAACWTRSADSCSQLNSFILLFRCEGAIHHGCVFQTQSFIRHRSPLIWHQRLWGRSKGHGEKGEGCFQTEAGRQRRLWQRFGQPHVAPEGQSSRQQGECGHRALIGADVNVKSDLSWTFSLL